MSAWRHARWFEPHEGIPVPGSVQPIRAQRGGLGAECSTCHEVLLPTPAPPAEAAQEVEQ